VSPGDLAAAADLRRRAAEALAEGESTECVSLLDEAKKRDPAGDSTPEVAHLRMRAHFHRDGKNPG
jgi:hypothetical protein